MGIAFTRFRSASSVHHTCQGCPGMAVLHWMITSALTIGGRGHARPRPGRVGDRTWKAADAAARSSATQTSTIASGATEPPGFRSGRRHRLNPIGRKRGMRPAGERDGVIPDAVQDRAVFDHARIASRDNPSRLLAHRDR